jgi:Ca2+-binding RTX toxin-like protein
VNLYSGSTQIGSTTADSSGNWTATVTLGQGTHSITATVTDAAGNTGPASLPVSISIDTTAPVVSTPDMAATSDTGSSSTDNVTTDITPTFTGTTEAGSTVKLFTGSTLIGTATADSSGTWSVTSSALAQGTYSITATATDAAGSMSLASAALVITIGTAPSTGLEPFDLPVSGTPTSTFTATARREKLNGTAGNDSLDDGNQVCTMAGGLGDDTYTVARSRCYNITEKGSAGIDTVVSQVDSFTLSGNVENLTLAGTNQRAIGNSLSNIITSTLGHNYLKGQGGDDILAAGGGDNKLCGGTGHDMFVFVDANEGNLITDFRRGDDLIDLRQVIAGTGYTGTDPVADHVIAITSNGMGGSIISVDLHGSVRDIVEIQGIAPSSLQVGYDVLWSSAP